MQSQDLLQLQLAKTLAQVRLDPMLRLAAQMAAMVTPSRPRRLLAQTLLAEWRKDIELAEDYPVLLKARAIAQAGSKPALQAAIAQSRLVAPKRARRREAQTLIAQWTGRIQVIEDRPIIQQAQVIATAGNLAEAIRTASQIRAGRTLYPEAQSLIDTWTTEIQIAEDQKTLDRAWNLAAAGNLSAAIELAAQIAPDRPLYSQVQGEIATWARERDAIWRARERESPGPESSDVRPEWSSGGGASPSFSSSPSPSSPSELPPSE
jgi:hypothetical protein